MHFDSKIPIPHLRTSDSSMGSRTSSEIEMLFNELSLVDRETVGEGFSLLQAAREKLAPLIDASRRFDSRPESMRPPRSDELQKISLNDCLVLTKSSVLVFDMIALGKSESEVIKWYQFQGYPQRRIDCIVESDREQKRSIAEVEELFRQSGIKEQRVFILDEIGAHQAAQLSQRFPVVFSLGGDDHAKSVAQHVREDQYFCIINSDPQRSTGAIASFSRDDLKNLTSKLAQGEFLIEEWPRLEIRVIKVENGRVAVIDAPPALSELSISDELSLYAFRGSINGEFLKDPIEVKGTGLIVANGVGSTGWFSSACKYVFPEGRKFLRTARHLEFIVREPYGRRGAEESYTGSIGPEDLLVVRTTSKHTPEVSADSGWKMRFTAGDEVQISLSKKPLRVITSVM